METARTIQIYNDGIIKILRVEDTSEPGDMPCECEVIKYMLRYDERTVGMHRYYAAMQNNVNIERMVRCQKIADVSTQDIAMIGDVRYYIRQVQYPKEIVPPSMDLSLERVVQDYESE